MSLDLRTLQEFVTQALQSGAPIPDVPELSRGAELHVGLHHELSPSEQLDIYRRQYWMRHSDALLEDYPGLAYALEAPEGGAAELEPGEGGPWERFVHAYLAQHPPAHASLRDLGHAVADFTAAHPLEELVGPARAALARDMARYEHLLVELFDAPDGAPLSAADLAGQPAEDVAERPLPLHHTVRLLALGHDVPELRLAVREERAPTADPAAWRRASCWAVFRPDFVVRYEVLDPAALELLRLLASPDGASNAPAAGYATTLAAACEALSERLPEERLATLGGELPVWLRRFVSIGLFGRQETTGAR